MLGEQAAHWHYWGKAQQGDRPGPAWHPFPYHSLDVVAVAGSLWDWSSTVRRAFGGAFGTTPEQSDQLRAWVLFFVALHDLGKLHARFQIKSPEAAKLAWAEFDPTQVARWAGHDYDHGHEGLRLIRREFPTWIGSATPDPIEIWERWSAWAAAVTGHHGDIPAEGDLHPSPREYAERRIMGHDAEARGTWVRQAAGLFLDPAGLGLGELPPVCETPGIHLLAGFCSLCDWVGSNADRFPYRALGVTEDQYFAERSRQIAESNLLSELGLTAEPQVYGGLGSLLRPNEAPRGLQVIVDALPLASGLILAEAPTGSGKTEAALALAWRLLEAGLADSVVFALPTQATANAMLARAEAFAERAFHLPNLVLAHGNRNFNHGFQALIEAGKFRTDQGRGEAAAQCAAWLASSRKKVFLGQIGVCTIDQVLLSVLPVRHSFVRGFGLSRSVLIIDEVHAYDAYMNGLLAEVLRRHKACGGSAILLSATLPVPVRADLLAAWDAVGPSEADYPVVWMVQGQSAKPICVPDQHRPSPRKVPVELIRSPDAFPDAALIPRIIAGARDGLVGVVMNTVDEAQRLARLLRDTAQVPVDLFHARFRLRDRQVIEQFVVGHYGRDGRRAGGRILVATQVIEQSLDLDFDWMVSQLCPVDLLFQRLGRLHRHAWRERPDALQHPHCAILCPDTEKYGVHGLIYEDARRLWRTERLLADRVQIEFPGAYREWIEAVYAPEAWDDEPETIHGQHLAWRQDQEEAKRRAMQRTTQTVKQFRDDDETVTSLTRDGEMGLTVLPLLEGGRLLDGTALECLDEHRLVEVLLLESIPVPCSWKNSLRDYERDDDGRIKLPLRLVTPNTWATADGRFSYTPDTGLERHGASEPDDPTPRRQPRGRGERKR